MSFNDPYLAYVEGSVFSGNPIGMVIALYEGAADAIRQARDCLESGDIWGRSKAINKGIKILTELLVSLDHDAGGEISANLKRIYSYLQCRLLEAHAQKAEAPLNEAEGLLNTMLEGWRAAAGKVQAETYQARTGLTTSYLQGSMTEEETASGYSLFNGETAELAGCVSEVF